MRLQIVSNDGVLLHTIEDLEEYDLTLTCAVQDLIEDIRDTIELHKGGESRSDS